MKKNILFALFSLFFTLKITAQNAELMIQTGHQTAVQYVALSPDESKLFTVDYDYVGILWDLPTGKQLRIFPDAMAGEFNADNRSIVIFMNNSTFKTVDLSGNVLKINSNRSVSEKMTRWERKLYAEQGLALYQGQMIDVNTGVYTKMQSNNYSAFVFSPLKGQVVLGGSSGKIDICDAKTGSLVKSFTLDLGEYGDAKFLNLSKDNNTFLAGSPYALNIVDFNTGNVLKVLKLYDKYGEILDATLSPNGKTVLFLNSNTLTMLDAATGNKIWEQKFKDWKFRGAYFTASNDNTIKVWDWETKNLLATMYSFAETNDWAVVTPSGRFDATKGAQEMMYFVKGETTIPLSALYEKFYTPRLLIRLLNGEKIDPVDVDVTKIKSPPSVKISAPVANNVRNLVVEDDKPNVRRYEMNTDKITLSVQADCPSDGVAEIRLFQNGKTIGSGTRNLVVEDENMIEKSKSQKFEIQLVEGENTFAGSVVDD